MLRHLTPSPIDGMILVYKVQFISPLQFRPSHLPTNNPTISSIIYSTKTCVIFDHCRLQRETQNEKSLRYRKPQS